MNKLLNEAIDVANKAYPDGKVAEYWVPGASQAIDTHAGDTLALFIAREIQDVAGAEGSRDAAFRWASAAMRKAARELDAVADALSEAGRSEP